MNALTITPRQAFEVARLLDRTGDGIVYAHDGILTLLVDVFGTGSPNLALELDRDGEVIARQLLALHRPDDDEFGDLSDEAPLPPPIDPSQARPAPRCECPASWGDDGTCGICGRVLREDADAALAA